MTSASRQKGTRHMAALTIWQSLARNEPCAAGLIRGNGSRWGSEWVGNVRKLADEVKWEQVRSHFWWLLVVCMLTLQALFFDIQNSNSTNNTALSNLQCSVSFYQTLSAYLMTHTWLRGLNNGQLQAMLLTDTDQQSIGRLLPIHFKVATCHDVIVAATLVDFGFYWECEQ